MHITRALSKAFFLRQDLPIEAQAGLEFAIFLPQPPEHWDYWSPSRWAWVPIFNSLPFYKNIKAGGNPRGTVAIWRSTVRNISILFMFSRTCVSSSTHHLGWSTSSLGTKQLQMRFSLMDIELLVGRYKHGSSTPMKIPGAEAPTTLSEQHRPWLIETEAALESPHLKFELYRVHYNKCFHTAQVGDGSCSD